MFDDPQVVQNGLLAFGLTAELRRRIPKIDGWIVVAVVAVIAVVLVLTSATTFDARELAQKAGSTVVAAVAFYAGLRNVGGKTLPAPPVREEARDTPTEPPVSK